MYLCLLEDIVILVPLLLLKALLFLQRARLRGCCFCSRFATIPEVLLHLNFISKREDIFPLGDGFRDYFRALPVTHVDPPHHKTANKKLPKPKLGQDTSHDVTFVNSTRFLGSSVAHAGRKPLQTVDNERHATISKVLSKPAARAILACPMRRACTCRLLDIFICDTTIFSKERCSGIGRISN